MGLYALTLEVLLSPNICIIGPFPFFWESFQFSFPKILYLVYCLISACFHIHYIVKESLAPNHMIVITKHFICMAFHLKHLTSKCVSCTSFNVNYKTLSTTSSNCNDVLWGMNTAWAGLINSHHNQVTKFVSQIKNIVRTQF